VESNADLEAFQASLLDPNEHCSYFDGGPLMYAIDIVGHGRIVYSSHAGCYSSILKGMQPNPDPVTLGVLLDSRRSAVAQTQKGSHSHDAELIRSYALFDGCASEEAVLGKD
jgi:hypothetical protein